MNSRKTLQKKQSRRRFLVRSAGLAGLVTTGSLVLVACSEATATQVPVTTEVSKPLPTVGATTAALATTIPTSATKALTTPAASLTAAPLVIPTVAGLKEIEIDSELSSTLLKYMPATANPSLKVYVSDDELEKVVNSVDAAATAGGYQFTLANQKKPVLQGASFFGYYTKDGSPDLLYNIFDTANATKELPKRISSLNSTAIQKLVTLVSEKKTLLTLHSIRPAVNIEIGAMDDFKDSSTTPQLVRLESPYLKSPRSAYIIKEANTYWALSNICTHNGCEIDWSPTNKQFECPCHGSTYNIVGQNTAGPAQTPLTRLFVSMRDNHLYVFTGRAR